MISIFTSISLLVTHSADENDNAVFGLISPLLILVCWLTISNPWRALKREPDSAYGIINKVRYFGAFILICKTTIAGVYNGIRYFFIN